MFTGIIEAMGKVAAIKPQGSNIDITVECPFTNELKIDQSLAHNGVCLTVVAINDNQYTVTAIDETLKRSNLGLLQTGSNVNLERCLSVGDRLDGHMVQGHVDTMGECVDAREADGSWIFSFKHSQGPGFMTVAKGSICINGVSLTVVDSGIDTFSVAIIPYTYEHTNFKDLKAGDKVNLEFDIVGKYLQKMAAGYQEI
jgi:riboflavin synthase